MEDNDPQVTRKRPRLDSGNGACESMSIDDSLACAAPDRTAAAPTASDQPPSTPRRSANKVTINMKSPVPEESASESTNPAPQDPGVAAPSEQTANTGAHASTAISVSSSAAQSPEIEVADVEDMDQDPNESNWRSLGETLRGQDAPGEVVQLQQQLSLTELFPKLSWTSELRENVEEIGSMIEKGKESCFLYAHFVLALFASKSSGIPG